MSASSAAAKGAALPGPNGSRFRASNPSMIVASVLVRPQWVARDQRADEYVVASVLVRPQWARDQRADEYVVASVLVRPQWARDQRADEYVGADPARSDAVSAPGYTWGRGAGG